MLHNQEVFAPAEAAINLSVNVQFYSKVSYSSAMSSSLTKEVIIQSLCTNGIVQFVPKVY